MGVDREIIGMAFHLYPIMLATYDVGNRGHGFFSLRCQPRNGTGE